LCESEKTALHGRARKREGGRGQYFFFRRRGAPPCEEETNHLHIEKNRPVIGQPVEVGEGRKAYQANWH